MHYRFDKTLENYPAVTYGGSYADLVVSVAGRLVSCTFWTAEPLGTCFFSNLRMYFGNAVVGP